MQLAYLLRDLLEALVLEEPLHELGSRVGPFFVVLGFDGRQQEPRLDPAQRGGHHQVFAGNVEIELFHELDGLHVLRRNLGDGDVGDIHLVDPDQMQQQVERPLEERQLDRDGAAALIVRHSRHRGISAGHTGGGFRTLQNRAPRRTGDDREPAGS